jgi:hypothetical protein
LKKGIGMAEKECVETISNETMAFHRKGCYDVTYMKTNGLALKENHGIQTIGIKGSEGYVIGHQRQVLKTLENYITELYDQANQQENLGAEHKEEGDSDEKGPYTSPVRWKEQSRRRGVRKLQEMMMYLGMFSYC